MRGLLRRLLGRSSGSAAGPSAKPAEPRRDAAERIDEARRRLRDKIPPLEEHERDRSPEQRQSP